MCTVQQHLTYAVQQAMNSGDYTRTQLSDEIIRLSKQHEAVLKFQDDSGIDLYDLVIKLRDEYRYEHDLDIEQCEQEEREFIEEEGIYYINVRLVYFSHERATRYGQYKVYSGLSDYDNEHGDACSVEVVAWNMDDDDCFDITYTLIDDLFDQIAVNAPTDEDIKRYIVNRFDDISRNTMFHDGNEEQFNDEAEKIMQIFNKRQ